MGGVGADVRSVRSESGASFVPWGQTRIFRSLLDGLRDHAIFGLDVAGLVATWNTGAQQLKGYAAEEILGRHFSVFYPVEDVTAGVPDAELAAAKLDGHLEADGWRVRKDGTTFWASVAITPVYDDLGQHYGFVKVTRDVTERRAANQALRDSEERFRLLVDGVRDYAIFALDVAGLVTSWNSGAEHLKGYADADILGRHFSVFYPLDDLTAGVPDSGAGGRQARRPSRGGWLAGPEGRDDVLGQRRDHAALRRPGPTLRLRQSHP